MLDVTLKEHDGHEYWESNIDGSFVCEVGKEPAFLKDVGRIENGNIGFNAREQKWYAWKGFEVAAFGIGSMVIPGDPAFEPSCKQDLACHLMIEQAKEDLCGIKKITFAINENNIIVSIKGENTERKVYVYPEKWGRGSYVCQTLDDAKQMAKDFVS